jgi:hypothetical protein
MARGAPLTTTEVTRARQCVTDYGQKKRERGAQLLYALCGANGPQEQDWIAREVDDLLMQDADDHSGEDNDDPKE